MFEIKLILDFKIRSKSLLVWTATYTLVFHLLFKTLFELGIHNFYSFVIIILLNFCKNVKVLISFTFSIHLGLKVWNTKNVYENNSTNYLDFVLLKRLVLFSAPDFSLLKLTRFVVILVFSRNRNFDSGWGLSKLERNLALLLIFLVIPPINDVVIFPVDDVIGWQLFLRLPNIDVTGCQLLNQNVLVLVLI